MIFVHLWWFFQRLTGASNTSGVAYGLWSGSWSDIGEITLLGLAFTWYKSTRCHVDTCHKYGRHPFQHYKLCKKHHPDVPDKLTHLHILKLHKEIK